MKPNCSRSGLALLLLLLICLVAPPAQSLAQTTANADAGNIIRPATRELRQLLNRARKALDEQDYPAAVQALEELLTDQALDDYFLAAPGQPDGQVSVKTMGSQLLGSLPAAARQLYETQVGHEARKQLTDALRDRDVAGVAEVARRFIHTKAGYEATFLLGRLEFDQGRALGAAITLQPLCEQPAARDLLDPELSVLTAAAWHHARREDKAIEVLVALKWRTPRVKVRLQYGEQPLFEREEDAIKWLEQVAGRGLAPAAAVANQWVMFRGDETRNAASAGGMPLVNSEWYFPTTNEPDLDKWVDKHARSLQDKGDSIVPVLQALAVSVPGKAGKRTDYVVVRSPEKVMGISLKTGKRLWVYPHNDPINNAGDKLLRGIQQAAATRENTVRQRIWEDNLYGQLSSDGAQLYFIDDLEYMNALTTSQMRGVWIGARPALANKAANKLTALNLRRQGTLCWTVGGESGGEDPNLAGAFFLGTPITVAERLYAMAEFNGELRLLCLSPESGALEWKQQLGSVPEETMTIRYDSTRRLAAASPSFADGVLVCPTSAGAVVAVDLGTRSLKWNYTYERNDLTYRTTRGVITSSAQNNNANAGHWLDSSAVIAEGSVIVTPIESQFLHCLDLVTGQPRWAPLKREDSLFVACVHKGKIIIVGKKNVRAINISDGKDAWGPVELNGEIASGRGFYSGTSYFLPITGQQLLKLDLDTGKVGEKARTEFTLGNLVSYEGEVISVGHDQIAAFYFVDYIRAQVEKDLAANPNDIRALARLGELLLTEDKSDEALEILRKAYQTQPGDVRIRGLLARVMLVLLRTDFVNNHELIAEAKELIDDPAQRRELLRLQAVGMHKAGLLAEALDAFVTLADELQTEIGGDEPGGAQMEYIDGKWQVRTSRWLQARLLELYTNSRAEDRAKLQERLEERLDRCLKTGTLTSARRFVEVYGFHPLADRARLLLVQKLLGEKNYLEAELRSGDLLDSADPNYRAAGLAALIETYDLAQRPHLAAERHAEFARFVAANPVATDHPAQELVNKALTKEQARKELLLDNWASGKAHKSEGSPESIRRQYMNNFSVNLLESTGPAPRGMRALYDPSQQAVQLIDSVGKTIAQAPIRRTDVYTRSSYPIPYSGLVGRSVGHIVAVHTGGEILAIDGLRPNRSAGEPILWRAEVVNYDPQVIGRSYSYPQSRQVSNPITGNRTMAFDQSGQTNYQPGPVTPFGIVYQRSKQLICVDPLTGETLWERSGLDPACDLFGDDEFVFAAAPNSEQATVFSMRDGAQLGTRTVGRSNTRLATNGRRILSWEQVGSTIRLRLFDAWSEKADLWKLETTTGAKGQMLDGNEFALLENTGKFQVISLASGEQLLQSQLQPETSISSLHVYRSLEQYTVLANTPIAESVPGLMTQPLTGGGMPGQQAHGRVYAIDRATGQQRWPVPAYIAQHGLPWDQPVDSPLLVFIRNRRGGNSGNWTSNLLCLDKRTGAVAYEGDIATAQANMCEVQADLEKQTVQITAWVQPGTMRVTLIKLTSEPQPPQPPAQTGNLSSLLAGQLPGTSVNVADAIFDPRRANAGDPNDPFAPAQNVIIGPNGRPIPIPPNMPAAEVERIRELFKRAEGQRPQIQPRPAIPAQPNGPPPAPKPEPPADDPFK